jgi:hypothetical protein
MPPYLFERSATFRAFFQVGSSCWPLLKAELELVPQAACPAPLLRGWFYARMSVPTYATGELVFVRNGYAARTPSVVVTLVEEALGVWRHEFTGGLAEVPHVWVGPGLRLIESLDELKKALSAASDDAVVARFNAEGGFRFSVEQNRDTSVHRNRQEH